jgi:hypothetical protein
MNLLQIFRILHSSRAGNEAPFFSELPGFIRRDAWPGTHGLAALAQAYYLPRAAPCFFPPRCPKSGFMRLPPLIWRNRRKKKSNFILPIFVATSYTLCASNLIGSRAAAEIYHRAEVCGDPSSGDRIQFSGLRRNEEFDTLRQSSR